MFTTLNGLTINSSEAYTVSYQNNDVLLTVVSMEGPASAAVSSRSTAAESRSIDTEIPAARDDNLRAAYLIGSHDDGGAHLTAALREFNAAYAVGGRQAVAVANEAVLTRQRIAERIGALNPIKQGRHQANTRTCLRVPSRVRRHLTRISAPVRLQVGMRS